LTDQTSESVWFTLLSRTYKPWIGNSPISVKR